MPEELFEPIPRADEPVEQAEPIAAVAISSPVVPHAFLVAGAFSWGRIALFVAVSLVIGASLIFVYFSGGTTLFGATLEDSAAAKPIVEVPRSPEYDERVFDDAAKRLQARAAIVYDIRTKKVLFAKNESSSLPLASLTKMLVAVTASGEFEPDDAVAISAEHLSAEGSNGLIGGETWSFKDIMDFTLLESSNDGARAIAAVGAARLAPDGAGTDAFLDKMNEQVAALGLTQTHFLNESGLDTSSDVGGAYGSAEDMAKLMAHIVSNEHNVLAATQYSELHFMTKEGYQHTAKNTNYRLHRIPDLIASKTGYTDLAGGNLAIAFDAGPYHPIAVVVLGSSREGRFIDAERLADATFAYFKTGTVVD